MKEKVLMVVTAGAILVLAAGCGEDEATPTPSGGAPAAALVAHDAGAAHALTPKGLEAQIEIDMHELYFGNSQGEKNPTFTVEAGKTVGIHFHNEGAVGHEILIGRKVDATTGEYSELLTEAVPSDLFFYYGDVRAEVGGAEFEELEVDPGMRDVWMRINIPAELKGEWELGCFVEGHYEGGMKAKFLVE